MSSESAATTDREAYPKDCPNCGLWLTAESMDCPRCMTKFPHESSAATVVQEMLEPCGDFPSKLEWLAFWLDGMDSILETVGKEPMGSDVQRDLRRWAVVLRGE